MIRDGRGNRFVKGTQDGRRRNFGKKFRSVGVASGHFFQARSGGVRKIRLRKTLDGFAVIGARVTGVATAFRAAAQPVDGIDRIGRGRIFLQKGRQALVGIRLFVEKGDPGYTPFGVEGIFATRKSIQHALVIAHRLGAVQGDPIEISRRHQRFFRPLALGIFLLRQLHGRQHFAFFFRRAVGLRQFVNALGIHFRIAGVQRQQRRRRGFRILLALRYAQLRALPCRIRRIAHHGQQFLVFHARFPPFVSVKKELRALLLQLDARIGIFLAQQLGKRGQRRARRFGFIAQRIFVEQRLIIFGRARQLMRVLVGLRAFQQQRGTRRGGGIRTQRVDGFLRMAEFIGHWHERFQELLFDGAVGIVLLYFLQVGKGIRIPAERAFGLRRPVQRIFPQYRIVLRLGQPSQRLRRAILRVVVVAQRQRRARTPDVGGMFVGEDRELLISTGNRGMQLMRQVRHFLLPRLFFGRDRRAFRHGGLWPAPAAARRGFRFRRFLTVSRSRSGFRRWRRGRRYRLRGRGGRLRWGGRILRPTVQRHAGN